MGMEKVVLQATCIDGVDDDESALLGDLSAAKEFLLERGVLRRGRPYAAAARGFENRVLLAARSAGVRAVELAQLIDASSSLPPLPTTINRIVVALRDIVTGTRAFRSALFVPAPALSAFAVARVALPIVYGSGLLRRTPHPIPVTAWSEEVDSAEVRRFVESHPGNSALLIANRGVIAYSDEPLSKLAKFVSSLEESAQLTLNAQLLGGARPLPRGAYEQMQQGIAGD
jgi:hypothetical protein